MQYCSKCRISIKGDKTECPLCGGRLTGDATPGGFPVLEKNRFTHMTVVKVATFCCITFFIIMLALEILYNFELAWVPFAVLGALIGWGDLMVGIYYRNNLIKTLSVETYLGMAVCLLSSYISTFIAAVQRTDLLLAALEISPLVEEVMKMFPVLFYLLIF